MDAALIAVFLNAVQFRLKLFNLGIRSRQRPVCSMGSGVKKLPTGERPV